MNAISFQEVTQVTRAGVNMFAQVWATSMEFRVAVLVLVLQVCFMMWATALVREITVAATTVLCKLLVYETSVSGAPSNHMSHTVSPAYSSHTRHKTDGGPPPGPPPPAVDLADGAHSASS